LRIDGKVLGNVIAVGGEPGTLVIGEHAEVTGEVRASHVVIIGKVVGPVIVDGYVELQPKARVIGDVSYKQLEMHLGAVLRGRLNHAEPGTASVVELKRIASE
jgi:cytoskeletal protein CcmA (bactofilin family)